VGLTRGSEMANEQGKFGGPLSSFKVREAEAAELTGAERESTCGALGKADAVQGEGDHAALEACQLGGGEAADCEGIPNTFVELAGEKKPCRMWTARAES
jgi:hypothetical protein